jgi:methylamine dehydrogenase heavy chain
VGRERQLSDALDADQDAWFHTAERIGDRFFFISFKGTLTELDLSGPAAKVLGSRPIAGTPQDAKRGWRPGGYQAFAVHPGGKVAVVSMHEGGREGSHKLWVLTRVRRCLPARARRGSLFQQEGRLRH